CYCCVQCEGDRVARRRRSWPGGIHVQGLRGAAGGTDQAQYKVGPRTAGHRNRPWPADRAHSARYCVDEGRAAGVDGGSVNLDSGSQWGDTLLAVVRIEQGPSWDGLSFGTGAPLSLEAGCLTKADDWPPPVSAAPRLPAAADAGRYYD